MGEAARKEVDVADAEEGGRHARGDGALLLDHHVRVAFLPHRFQLLDEHAPADILGVSPHVGSCMCTAVAHQKIAEISSALLCFCRFATKIAGSSFVLLCFSRFAFCITAVRAGIWRGGGRFH